MASASRRFSASFFPSAARRCVHHSKAAMRASASAVSCSADAAQEGSAPALAAALALVAPLAGGLLLLQQRQQPVMCLRRNSSTPAWALEAAAAAESASKPVSEDASTAGTSALDLRPFHLASWQKGVKVGRVEEVCKVPNPMALQWPGFEFGDPNKESAMVTYVPKRDHESELLPKLGTSVPRAEPTRDIYWNPKHVRAGIVICGDLCPGLNSIVREVTTALHHAYGINNIVGFQGGFHGLSAPDKFKPLVLTPERVTNIHHEGGCILRTGHGGFDEKTMCDTLENMGINMLFVVGGMGAQRAAHKVYEECQRRNVPISVVGIPKSIDNDILIFDKYFGFDTGVAEAATILRSACPTSGVCIVKVNGRCSGFFARQATLASTLVDIALIPEVDFKLEDVLAHIDKTVARKNHCLVVVAEGAGKHLIPKEQQNKQEIGRYLQEVVDKHLEAKNRHCQYIDATKLIRTSPVRPMDHIYCTRLGHNAVHIGMRGYTGVSVGGLNNEICMVPLYMVSYNRKTLQLKSGEWQLAVQTAKMPASLSGLSS